MLQIDGDKRDIFPAILKQIRIRTNLNRCLLNLNQIILFFLYWKWTGSIPLELLRKRNKIYIQVLYRMSGLNRYADARFFD